MKLNKYLLIFINLIILLSICFGLFLVYSYFSHKDNISNKQNHNNKNTKITYTSISNLSNIKSIDDSISYLKSINKDLEFTYSDKSVKFDKEVKNNVKKVITKNTPYVPYVSLNNDIDSDFSKVLSNNNIKNIAISSPVSDNKNISENWSLDKKIDANIKKFISSYSKFGNISLTLNQKYDSLMNTNMPEILRVKLLYNILKKYNIHNIIIDLNSNTKDKNYEKFCSEMYLLQTYLNREEYKLSYDITIAMDESGIIDNQEDMIRNYLNNDININSFIIKFQSNNNIQSSDILTSFTESATSLKKVIQKMILDSKSITLNDSIINSLISFSPTITNKQTVGLNGYYSKELSKIYEKYGFSKIILDNINDDYHLDIYKKSLFENGTFSREFIKLNNYKEINKDGLFKIFRSNKVNEKKLLFNLTSLNIIDQQLPLFSWKIYEQGEKIIYNNHIFRYKNLKNIITSFPIVGKNDESTQWEDLGTNENKKEKDNNEVEIKVK